MRIYWKIVWMNGSSLYQHLSVNYNLTNAIYEVQSKGAYDYNIISIERVTESV